MLHGKITNVNRSALFWVKIIFAANILMSQTLKRNVYVHNYTLKRLDVCFLRSMVGINVNKQQLCSQINFGSACTCGPWVSFIQANIHLKATNRAFCKITTISSYSGHCHHLSLFRQNAIQLFKRVYNAVISPCSSIRLLGWNNLIPLDCMTTSELHWEREKKREHALLCAVLYQWWNCVD